MRMVRLAQDAGGPQRVLVPEPPSLGLGEVELTPAHFSIYEAPNRVLDFHGSIAFLPGGTAGGGK